MEKIDCFIDCFDDQKVAEEMDGPGAILKKIGNAQASPIHTGQMGQRNEKNMMPKIII